jgi:hypothetical protein
MDAESNWLEAEVIERDHMADRFVGMFDMLGFKHMIESTALHDVVARAKRFVQTARRATIVAGPNCDDHLNVVVFQDTILVTTPTSSDADLKCCVHYACGLIGFAFDEGFLIRGAIVRGEAHVEHDMVVGRAIVEAYRMEQAQEWMGCWLDDACIDQASRSTVDELKDSFIVRYSVPLKSGPFRKRWALNWTLPFCVLGRDALFVAWNREWRPACTDGAVTWDVRNKLQHTDRFLGEVLRLGWLPDRRRDVP